MSLQRIGYGMQVGLRIAGLGVLDLRYSGRRQANGLAKLGLGHAAVFAPFPYKGPLKRFRNWRDRLPLGTRFFTHTKLSVDIFFLSMQRG